MNKRIKKLYDQAMEPNGIEGLGGSYYDLNPEKFAELIIKECQKCVSQYIHECGEVASLPDHVLNRHFGVDE